jgi:hypothetical protein
MSDYEKFWGNILFIVVFMGVVIDGGIYLFPQNQYRKKTLTASVEIEKSRQHTEHCKACRERLDAILGHLERIEMAIKP